jgi:hypothetical protein
MTLSAYCGVDLHVTSPCRCGCASLRVHPHSSKSKVPIWKCAWCGDRRVRLTEIEIKTFKNFVRLFGWPGLPLIFHDDGYVYAYGQLSALRQARNGVRWEDGNVSALSERDANTSGGRLLGEGRSAVAGAEATLRSARVARVIKEHDEYLKKRGWYDAITATLDENWVDGGHTEI